MRAWSLLLVIGLTAGLACGRQRAAAAGGGLAYYETYDPRSLDPALSTDVPTGEMVTCLFDGLTQFDADGRLLPGLADRWTVERGGLRYVFHLRAGVKFHDGRPVTPAEVRASFLRVLDPATTGGRAWPLLPIAGAQDFASRKATDVRGIQLLGDSAVAIELTEPLAVFPKFLAMAVAAIVPAPTPPDFGQHPVGSGPWKFVRWQHDDYLIFARNTDYWGGAPQADTFVVRILPEPLTQSAEFDAGRLSVVEVPFGETARWQREHPDLLVRKPGLRAVYVAMNLRRGPLQDVRVRQALNYAVNVPEILQTVWSGRGVIARGSVPPSLPGGDTTRRGYDYDPIRARQLLTAAGYPNGLDLELWRTATNVSLARVAQAVQADLEKVGVRVTIVDREAASMREAARAGKADLALLDWWADYPDAENFLYPLFYSGNAGTGGNYSFYHDGETDSLLARARRTLDDSARIALYQRIDERVYRSAPWVYLWFPVELWAHRPDVHGWDFPLIFTGQRWTGVRRTM